MKPSGSSPPSAAVSQARVRHGNTVGVESVSSTPQ